MGSDLIQSANKLPAEIREKMAAAVAADLARLGNIGGKDAIRITQDKKFVFPDETSVDGPLDLVIVDFVYRNEYYPGAFNRKEPTAPTCFAVNPVHAALAPTPNSPKMQVEPGKLCKDCQWDQYGSSPQGEGKACKNTIYMAVLQGDATADSPLLVIKTSPTAIRHMNKYIATVGRETNLAVWGVLSRLSFDPKLSYASLRFDMIGLNPVLEETIRRQDEARHRLLQEPDFSSAVL